MHYKMKSNILKLAISVVAIASPLSYSQTSVPVTDTTLNATVNTQVTRVDNTIQSGFNMINTTANTGQEQEKRLADESVKANAATVQQAFVESERRLNAERFSAHMGAKIKPACANTMLAKVFKEGADLESRVQLSTNRRYKDHIERNKYLSVGESVQSANVNTFLNKISSLRTKRDLEDQALRTASKSSSEPIAPLLFDKENSLSLSPDESGLSPYMAHVDRIKYLIDPFPTKLQPNFDDPNQPPSTREESAKALWRVEMLNDVGRIINSISKTKGETYSAEFIRYLFPDGEVGQKMMESVLHGIDDNTVSKSAAIQIMNRYRMMSKDWQVYNGSNSGSLHSKAGDLNLMAAQMLMNQDVQNNLLTNLVELQVLMVGMMLAEHNPSTSGQ